jgi:patatin-related protein
MTGEAGAATQEIRVAAVTVGGMSLGVWMSGVACELERLVRAERGPDGGLYGRLKQALDVSVVVDVLAGTSAGGICASALALSQSRGGDLLGLRDAWLQLGSLDNLLRSPYDTRPPSLLRGDEVMLAGLGNVFARLAVRAPAPAGGASLTPPAPPPVAPAPRQAAQPAMATATTAPGGGPGPVRNGPVRNGSAGPASTPDPRPAPGQAAEPATRTARPHPSPTSLMLCTTLLQGVRNSFRDDYGTLVNDIDHLGLLTFDERQLAESDVPARLALATRASASFPYAFEPARIPVHGVGADAAHPDLSAHTDFGSTRFAVDGGILANRPLRPALEEVYARTAHGDVRRVLAYLVPTTAPVERPMSTAQPSLRETLVATATAALSQSVAHDLAQLREHNDTVAAARTVRTHLCRLASPVRRLTDTAMFASYVDKRAGREADELVAAMTAALQALADRSALPTEWAPATAAVQPIAPGWRAAVLRRRSTDLWAADMPTGSADEVAPRLGRLGVETFERACAVVVDLAARAYRLPDPPAEEISVVKAALARLREEVAGTSRPGMAARRSAAGLVAARLGTGEAGRGLQEVVDDLVRWWSATLNGPPDLSYSWRKLGGAAWTLSAAVGQDDPVAGYLARAGDRSTARTGDDADLVAVRLADLIVAEEVFGTADRIADQRVELVQMTADTRTNLTRTDAGYRFSAAADKLTGLQLYGFGGFYKASWRASDWMWGRLDGVGWFVHLLLAPTRVRRRFDSTTALLAALQVVQDPPAAVRAELDALFAVPADHPDGLPPSLPETSMWLAEGPQADVAATELVTVRDQILADGEPSPAARAFVDQVSRCVHGAAVDPDRVRDLLLACPVPGERLEQDTGSRRFAITASKAAATAVGTVESMAPDQPPPVRALTGPLRSGALLAYLAAQGLGGRLGTAGLATGFSVATASVTGGLVHVIAVVAIALLMLALIWRGLVAERRSWLRTGLVALTVAVMLSAGVAGLIPYRHFHDWPVTLVEAFATWLHGHWWGVAVLALAAGTPVLLTLLRRHPARTTTR